VRGSVSSQCTSSSSKAPMRAVATWPKGRSTSCRPRRAGGTAGRAVGEHRDHPAPVLLEPGAPPPTASRCKEPGRRGVVGQGWGDGGGEAGADAGPTPSAGAAAYRLSGRAGPVSRTISS
jgi:hypothetical protein